MTALINPFWYGAAGDPNFANVVLLCHFDGANGSTTFTDNSLAAHTLTATGTISLTTAQQKFGTASLQAGTASSAATSADSADWDFGAGQFTVEAWVRPTSAISGVRGIVAQYGASSLAWFLGFNGAQFGLFVSANGTTVTQIVASYTPTLNAWLHVAADRDAGGVVRVYAAGAALAAITFASAIFNSTNSLYIGIDGNLNRNFVGQIDEVRITKGVARYGGAFTPPAAPFPDA